MFPQLPITIDLNKTLEQLDSQPWGEPPFSSHLVTTTHRLRQKSLRQFTTEDLRITLGQQFSINVLLPLALNRLLDEPSAGGDFYKGDLLNVVLKIDAAVWRTHPLWWTTLQLIMYQLEFQLKSVANFTAFILDTLLQQWSTLQATVDKPHPVIQTMIALHLPQTAARDGGFIVLYAYDRWHLLTMANGDGRPNSIRTAHFMQADGVWRLWSLYCQAPRVDQYNDIDPTFASEVGQKILPTAQHYVHWLQQGLQVMIGETSDAQIIAQIGATPDVFVRAIQKSMVQEVPGFSLVFPM